MKFTPGPAIAAASGSVGGTVFSRNRYGAYTRFRAVPVTATSTAATNAKNYMTAASQAWRGLTDAQRLQWSTWAAANPIIDNLGQQQILQGNSAYVSLNARLLRAGVAQISVPPAVAAPAALNSMSIVADIGAGGCSVTFTPTPTGANVGLFGYFAVVNSAGVNFIKNLRKLCTITAGAQVTGYDFQADVEARFGTLAVGQYVIAEIATIDRTTGLISGFLRSRVAVTTT